MSALSLRSKREPVWRKRTGCAFHQTVVTVRLHFEHSFRGRVDVRRSGLVAAGRSQIIRGKRARRALLLARRAGTVRRALRHLLPEPTVTSRARSMKPIRHRSPVVRRAPSLPTERARFTFKSLFFSQRSRKRCLKIRLRGL